MQWTGSGEGLSLALRLSQLRSAIRVGVALATRFPDEAAWEAEVTSEEFQETMTAFAEILDDVNTDLDATPSDDDVATTILRHHGRGLEAVELLAEKIQVPVDDLVTVLSG